MRLPQYARRRPRDVLGAETTMPAPLPCPSLSSPSRPTGRSVSSASGSSRPAALPVSLPAARWPRRGSVDPLFVRLRVAEAERAQGPAWAMGWTGTRVSGVHPRLAWRPGEGPPSWAGGAGDQSALAPVAWQSQPRPGPLDLGRRRLRPSPRKRNGTPSTWPVPRRKEIVGRSSVNV